MNIGEHGEGLIPESFWKVTLGGLDDFFVVCSGHIFSLSEPYEVPEIAVLPAGAIMLVPKGPGAQRGDTADNSLPTESAFGKISYIGSFTGDDRTIVLANGAVAWCGLDSNPQAIFEDRPEDFVCRRVMEFYEPEVVREWLTENPKESCPELVRVRMLDREEPKE